MADIDLSQIIEPRAVALSATEKMILLSPYKKYTITHLGIDVARNDDAQSALPAFFHSATGVADFTASETAGLRCLLDNSAMVFDGWGEDVVAVNVGATGPTSGATPPKRRLYMIGPTGADAMIQFEPHNNLGT